MKIEDPLIDGTEISPGGSGPKVSYKKKSEADHRRTQYPVSILLLLQTLRLVTSWLLSLSVSSLFYSYCNRKVNICLESPPVKLGGFYIIYTTKTTTEFLLTT